MKFSSQTDNCLKIVVILFYNVKTNPFYFIINCIFKNKSFPVAVNIFLSKNERRFGFMVRWDMRRKDATVGSFTQVEEQL